jgi:hypothetical protein
MITIITRKKWQRLVSENKQLRDELAVHGEALKELRKKTRRMEISIETMKKIMRAEKRQQKKLK